jgi:hypothetical protein
MGTLITHVVTSVLSGRRADEQLSGCSSYLSIYMTRTTKPCHSLQAPLNLPPTHLHQMNVLKTYSSITLARILFFVGVTPVISASLHSQGLFST